MKCPACKIELNQMYTGQTLANRLAVHQAVTGCKLTVNPDRKAGRLEEKVMKLHIVNGRYFVEQEDKSVAPIQLATDDETWALLTGLHLPTKTKSSAKKVKVETSKEPKYKGTVELHWNGSKKKVRSQLLKDAKCFPGLVKKDWKDICAKARKKLTKVMEAQKKANGGKVTVVPETKATKQVSKTRTTTKPKKVKKVS